MKMSHRLFKLYLAEGGANILVDMEGGHLTPVIFRHPYEIAVPDILFE